MTTTEQDIHDGHRRGAYAWCLYRVGGWVGMASIIFQE